MTPIDHHSRLLSPDPAIQEQERRRCAESALQYCIQRVGWDCSIDMVRLLTAEERPLNEDDINACLDAVHVRVEQDKTKYPTCNVSIYDSIHRAEDQGVLPPSTLDDYRMHYTEKLLAWIAAVLPVYYPHPPERSADVAETKRTILRMLEQYEEPSDILDEDTAPAQSPAA